MFDRPMGMDIGVDLCRDCYRLRALIWVRLVEEEGQYRQKDSTEKQ
jgi:hypothetical protein